MDIFEYIIEAKKKNEPLVLATVIESLGSAPRKAGARMIIQQDGTTIGTVGGGAIEKIVADEALKIMGTSTPKTIKHTLKDIGKNFGGRDHTTVLYSVKAVQDLMDTDLVFKDKVTELEKQVQLNLH